MRRAYIFAALLMCSVMLNAQTKETAVLFSGMVLDESYLLTEKVSVVFNEGDEAWICLDGKKQSELKLDALVTAKFKDAFRLKANKDPDHTENYYATFFTNECAYKLPKDESAKAYAGTVDDKLLKMTNIGSIIHKGEPVVLKAASNSVLLMPSCDEASADVSNDLLGTDVKKTLGENDYVLSLGQNGVGFYLWKGKEIDANKVYLTLPYSAKVLMLDFDDEPTGITSYENPSTGSSQAQNDNIYNLKGMRVYPSTGSGRAYKGIVIKNGKKIYQK